MIQINRIKCIINTANDGDFGFDYILKKGINLISSTENTKGKSSILQAIYYCFGVEELLGGVNEKALTPVYKTSIDYGEKKNILPLKTSFYLEIINDKNDIITINRDVEHTTGKNNLIKVFWGNIEQALTGKCDLKEMFVNTSGGATSDNGFHKFLEEYIGWKLPIVPTFEEKDRKLYLQTIFSSIFIEQKRGWSNLLANIPNYGIKDSRTKVIEYILGLNTIENERLKIECKIEETLIKERWVNIIEKITSTLNNENCVIRSLYNAPTIISEINLAQMIIFKNMGEEIKLDEYMQMREQKLKKLSNQSLKVGNNIEELESKLKELQDEVQVQFNKKREKIKEKTLENLAIKKLKESLEIINKDLQNNKDISKLKKLGGLQDSKLIQNICPTCNQTIKDCLLEQPQITRIMDVEEQIKHLSDQKKMIEYSIASHKSNLSTISNEVVLLEVEISDKVKEIRRITNDIYSTDESLSTAIVYEKVYIENELDVLKKMGNNINTYKNELLEISKEWEKFLIKKSNLPKGIFSENDLIKLKELKNVFIEKLKKYNYSSNQNIYNIEISKDKLIPTLNGFDLIKDGSGSDLIRIIWSFTLSLLTVSNTTYGNHPQLIILDEPAQQSIENKDLYNFINDLIDNYSSSQIIIGITLNNNELENYVKGKKNINCILIEEKAIRPI